MKYLIFAEHNFISPDIGEIQEQAREVGVEIPTVGIEISAVTHREGQPFRKVHLLGYGDNLLDPEFQEMVSLPLKIKNNYRKEVINKLRRELPDLPSFEEILKGIDLETGIYTTPHKQQMTRTQIAIYIHQITGEDIETVKKKYLPQIPEEMSYEAYLKAEDIIPIVRYELYGVIGYAHPLWARPFKGKSYYEKDMGILLEEIMRLRKLGLEGIEVYHKYHSPEHKHLLGTFAEEMRFLIVGGSDYHGKKQPLKIGDNGLTQIQVEKFLDYLDYLSGGGNK